MVYVQVLLITLSLLLAGCGADKKSSGKISYVLSYTVAFEGVTHQRIWGKKLWIEKSTIDHISDGGEKRIDQGRWKFFAAKWDGDTPDDGNIACGSVP